MNPIYQELMRGMLPEAALVAGALLVLGIDLLWGRGRNASRRLSVATGVALIAIAAAAWAVLHTGLTGPLFGSVLIIDALAWAARLGVLGLAALTFGVLGGTGRLRNPAEYVAIILLATAGFTLMAAAQQLLVAFLALELASLSLYVLTGFDKTRAESAEAALKYFLFGGISAAFLLFGFSLIYGLTGSIDLPEIAVQLRGLPANPLLTVGLVMILVGFGFKAAAAPFHLWAPDAYQGAPTPSAALIASASKLAGFALFVRLLWAGLSPNSLETAPSWIPVVVIISAVSLVLGNLAALAQSNVRRLLAYSAISHAGALLLGVIVAGRAGPSPVFYYAATYGIATVGAFGVLAVIERTARSQQLTDLAGLTQRSPLLAGCLAVFVLSLAGIPPLAGFFGKFAVFAEALKLNGLSGPTGWLALLAIAMSAVGLYYYLLILKQALVARTVAATEPIRVPASAALALLTAAVLLIVLGAFPSLLLDLVR